MEEIAKVTTTFNAPIGNVWAVIAAFGAIKDWFPGVTSCSLEGDGIGAIRKVNFNGVEAVERLEVCDSNIHCVVYRLMDPALIPAEGCTGTMQLTALNSNRTQLEWTAHAESISGSKTELASHVSAVYEEAVVGIKNFIGC